MQSENMQNTTLDLTQNNPKASLGDKVWQFIRFAVITGMIFAVSFFAMNFHAYKSIFASMLNPEQQQKTGQILEGAAGGKAIDPSLLLPVLNQEKETTATYAWLDFPVVPTDNRLVIPKLAKSVPIVEMGTEHLEGENWTELEKQIQSTLQHGVLRYPGTAQPGQYGNVFITGHSSYYPWDPGKYKDVFAILDQLEVGDEYIVYYDQKKYTYKIFEKVIVNPNDTSVLQQPQDKLISTLMTCYPVGTTTSRMIIKAEQVQ